MTVPFYVYTSNEHVPFAPYPYQQLYCQLFLGVSHSREMGTKQKIEQHGRKRNRSKKKKKHFKTELISPEKIREVETIETACHKKDILKQGQILES